MRYTKTHEWVSIDAEKVAIVGITVFAQDQLGDVVFLDLPKPGTHVNQFQKLGEIESVKTVSDFYSPVTGEVLSVNESVADHPDLVNKSPEEQGWLIKLSCQDPSELDNLLDLEQYKSTLVRDQGGH